MRLSKWRLRFLRGIFLRLDSILACIARLLTATIIWNTKLLTPNLILQTNVGTLMGKILDTDVCNFKFIFHSFLSMMYMKMNCSLLLHMTFWNFWFVCRCNCASISMLIIHQFKTYFCMTFSIWRRVTWSLWIFEKMTFWNFWFVLNCASISMFNIWVLTYFGQWKKGYTTYSGAQKGRNDFVSKITNKVVSSFLGTTVCGLIWSVSGA